MVGGFDGGGFNLELQGFAMEARLAAGSAEHRHFPYARRVRLGWVAGPDGWQWASEDAHYWEVYCGECGDTDGPADRQTLAVQQLRGPYRGEHHARHVATRHFEAN